MKHHRLLAAACAVFTFLVATSGTFASSETATPNRPRKAARRVPEARRAIPLPVAVRSPYRGLGTWIDMFDASPWQHPERAVDRMAALGVKTLYLQTSNWRKRLAIYKPAKTSRLIDRAHQKGISVVAWYLPAFNNLRRDFRRVKAAIEFQSEGGNRFDSFALDIEATEVRDISARNKAALRLSRRIRAFVGEQYRLGAIIPDPAGQAYWPSFPYAGMAESYDVFLPMGYYTYRTSGYRDTYRYAKRNVTIIRAQSGDPEVPVHAIGGIAGRGTRREVQAFLDGSRAAGVTGLSLYDFPITRDWEWKKLTR